jgi:hypothetical protein
MGQPKPRNYPRKGIPTPYETQTRALDVQSQKELAELEIAYLSLGTRTRVLGSGRLADAWFDGARRRFV